MDDDAKRDLKTVGAALIFSVTLFLVLPWIVRAAKWYCEWAWKGLGTWNS